jgi:transposase
MTRHHPAPPGSRDHYEGPMCRFGDGPVAWCGQCTAGVCDPHRVRRDRVADAAFTEFGVVVADHFGRVCAWCGSSFRDGSAIGVSLDDDYVCEDCTP